MKAPDKNEASFEKSKCADEQLEEVNGGAGSISNGLYAVYCNTCGATMFGFMGKPCEKCKGIDLRYVLICNED